MKFLFSHPHFGVFFLSLFFADIFTPIAKHLAWLAGVVDYPAERKLHRQPTALLGGLAVFSAYLLAVISTLEYTQRLLVVTAATALLFFLGLLDDIFHVPAIAKLMALFFLTLALFYFGITIESLPRVFSLPVTLLWFAYVASCFNGIDNVDGLCAGVGAIASFFFYLISFETGQSSMGYIAIALCGACVGFLRYNLLFSKIFLGDSGAFFIGFTLSAISVMGHWGTTAEAWKAMLVPLCILFIPLYDLFLTTLLRFRRGIVRTLPEAISYSAKDHLSHRIMLQFGFSPFRTVLLLYLLSALWGFTGLLVRLTPPLLAVSLAGIPLSLTLGLTLKIKDAPVRYPS